MNDKELLLVTTALRLFYAKGIHSVGINELLNESGVAKKTLYSYFSSKEDLVLAALRYRDERFTTWLEGRMAQVEAGKPAILALFAALDDWFNDEVTELGHFRGCFFINTSAEFCDPTSPIAAACQAHKRKIQQLIAQQVSQFEADGQRATAMTEAIAMLKEGAIVTAMVQQRPDAAAACLPLLERLLLLG